MNKKEILIMSVVVVLLMGAILVNATTQTPAASPSPNVSDDFSFFDMAIADCGTNTTCLGSDYGRFYTIIYEDGMFERVIIIEEP